MKMFLNEKCVVRDCPNVPTRTDWIFGQKVYLCDGIRYPEIGESRLYIDHLDTTVIARNDFKDKIVAPVAELESLAKELGI